MPKFKKPEMEFWDTELVEWKPVEGMNGAWEKILSRCEETGSYTRLLKFAPGFKSDKVLAHDFWEEVYIVDGYLIDKTLGKTFTKGMYACRPPGMKHGPYECPIGCITIEFRYYVD